jgi:hypothetical protein
MYAWWERSPRTSDTTTFGFVNDGGSASDLTGASSTRGLAPFGCI